MKILKCILCKVFLAVPPEWGHSGGTSGSPLINGSAHTSTLLHVSYSTNRPLGDASMKTSRTQLRKSGEETGENELKRAQADSHTYTLGPVTCHDFCGKKDQNMCVCERERERERESAAIASSSLSSGTVSSINDVCADVSVIIYITDDVVGMSDVVYPPNCARARALMVLLMTCFFVTSA